MPGGDGRVRDSDDEDGSTLACDKVRSDSEVGSGNKRDEVAIGKVKACGFWRQ